jgi:OmcA/MtrC family decaheme c-type cytochrome
MFRPAGLIFTLTSAVLIQSSDKPAFSPQAAADQALVAFIRPGLVTTITGASIASDGTIKVNFTLADPKGRPLDRSGVTTPGPVSTSFIAAVVPNGGKDYIAYTSRPQVSSITKQTAIQPSADSGGAYQQTGDGQYTYTFATKAPAGFNAAATHTVGVYSSRDLTEFSLGINFADAVFNFVPNGAAVTNIHDAIQTASCNKCHDPLSAHGGARRSLPLCVLCHNPGGGGTQTIDPDTGNSIDMKVMAHKIHAGETLPSVQAGTPYQIIGFQGSVNDYSTVAFPANIRNCTMCHDQSLAGQPGQGLVSPPAAAPGTNPPHANDWLMRPSMAACGSCHDNVNFTTGKNHATGLPVASDAQCSQCHIALGEIPFDASIVGAHTIPQFAPGLPGVVFGLTRVDNGGAGKSPTVTFTLKDLSGNAIAPSAMSSLNLVMAGPTGDYTTLVSEDARGASGNAGTYTYTFKAVVPAGATGSYTVGIEGYRNAPLPEGAPAATVRDVGHNVVLSFSVDGSPVAAHPVEFTNAQCNQCHYQISAHGTIRNEAQYCILCHNPTATDAARRPAAQNPTQSIDMPVMIHRIHLGEDAQAGDQLTPYIVYGFGGSVNDFSEVRYPGDLRNCNSCHVNGSQQLPLPATRVNVTNPRAFINPTPPITAACTGCHVAKAVSAHASQNTSQLGEACAVCHDPDGDFSVDAEHSKPQ